jgi:hypothetical protein
MTIKADETSSARAVSFNTRVTVVLIPERKELKEANCDLWWNREEFFGFQQSAHSEIRLFALYENCNCKEAKQLLYQPCMEPEVTYPEEERESLDMSTRYSENEEISEKERLKPPSPPATLIRHVDSVTLLSDYLEEDNSTTNLKRPQSAPAGIQSSSNPYGMDDINVSLISRAKSSIQDMTQLDEPDQQIKRTPAGVLASPGGSDGTAAATNDPHFYVSLCVPSVEYGELSVRERPGSGGAGGAGKARRRRSSSQQRLDQSSGFAVAFGIFSFTLPIIGYYLMHYSN